MCNAWQGKLIKPVSQLTSHPPVWIDRARVRFYKTLEGDGYYIVEGSRRGADQWYPLAEATQDPDKAWEAKERIERALWKDRMDFNSNRGKEHGKSGQGMHGGG